MDTENNSDKQKTEADTTLTIDDIPDYQDYSEEHYNDDEDDIEIDESDPSGGNIFVNIRKYEGGYKYEVLNSKDIMVYMTDSINEANMVLQLPPTTLRILLNFFQWNIDKLFEKYYDCDQSTLFKEAGIPDTQVFPKTVSIGSGECGICFTESPANLLRSLGCGHRFCLSCWKNYLTSKIMNEGMGETIPCAGYKCDFLTDDIIVMELVTDAKVIERYQCLIANSFVHCNRRLRWCASPTCSLAIKVDYKAPKPTKCTCGFSTCFTCGLSWHGPITCSMLKKWTKKCDDDSETSNWISANTKECPKCHTNIEKNGGCNHMTCKNANCKYEYCWVCLQDFKSHTGTAYNCNSFVPEDTKNKDACRNALQRYLFYCNRYMSHMSSLKFENKLHGSIEPIMEEWQARGYMIYFLPNVVDILCHCRQTLMYTYAFAYYLVKTTEAEIFEENQRDLQVATESLSALLENDLLTGEAMEMREKLLNSSSYCERRRLVLLEHVYEGYERDGWKYNEN